MSAASTKKTGGADRLAACFEALSAQGRTGLVTYVMGGDPDRDTCRALLAGLPDAGADIIELGMAFSDPMADGPVIQAAGLRALANGASVKSVLTLAAEFRRQNARTPLILMGYYNPVYRYGPARFVEDCAKAGVDGLIIVDLPPEEDEELRPLAEKAGLHCIRLVTPTTDAARLPTVLENSSGFLYYVSVTGVTGTKSAQNSDITKSIFAIRHKSPLPVVAGFGIRTPEQAAALAGTVDAVVVGSAIVARVAEGVEKGDKSQKIVSNTLDFVKTLAAGLAGSAGRKDAQSAG